MADLLEVREKQKLHLLSLLRIKSLNPGLEIKGLQEEVVTAIAPMEHEDIAWVEKLTNVKAV